MRERVGVCMDGASVGVRQTEADIVEQDDEDVGGIRRQLAAISRVLIFMIIPSQSN
jgi:hypothetical protein